MGDVANILGVQSQRSVGSAAEEATKILAAKPMAVKSNKQAKPKGMSREVFSLMGVDSMAPIAPANAKIVSGLKNKRASLVHGKWVWAPFTNSARVDGQEFYHWVKASIEYPDYPYAKFNAKVEAVMYSTEEYDVLLQSSQWNRSETDHLMDLCYGYDLRWPVIVDRYALLPPRTLDEIRSRYYYVVSRVKKSRTGITEDAIKSENFVSLDIDYEKQRRANVEIQFRKTKEHEVEEKSLKDELKGIDSTLKKLKKTMPSTAAPSQTSGPDGGSGGSKSQPAAAAESKPGKSSASSSGHTAAAATAALYNYDSKIPPKPHAPIPGRPHLQSSRLVHDDPSALNISKSRIQKMDLLLTELGLPENVTPTKAVCDLYDEVRRDTIALLSVQHTITQKEAELAKFHAVTAPRALLQQKQKVLNMPFTDLLVPSTSQVNSRIQQEVEDQLQAAKKLAEVEFVQSVPAVAGAAGAAAKPTAATPDVAAEEAPFVKKDVKQSKRKANAMSAAIAVTKDMVAEGNVPPLSFINSDENPKGNKRKKSA